MTFAFAAGAQVSELRGGDGELREHRRESHRDVVGAENKFDVSGLKFEAKHRAFIRGEIGFRTVKPDGRGVVSIAGEEEACGAVKEADGIGGVAGGGDDLDFTAAEVEDVAVLNVFRDGPGLGAIGFGVEPFGEVAADLAGS